MKNTYYVIFMLCLIANQTKPMITYNQSNSEADYYNLQYMPEDILKEIAIQQSGAFSLEDLKTAKYYKECLSKNRTLSDAGTAMLETTSKYANAIQRLSVINKQLHETLTDLRNQSNPVSEEKALLKLNYFYQIFIDYSIYKKRDRFICNILAQLQYNKPVQKMPIFFIDLSVSFPYNEYETLKTPKAVELMHQNSSFSDADYALQMVKQEVFDNETEIEKLIILMHYFDTISKEHTFGNVEPNSIKYAEGTAHCRIYFSNEQLIPYLLIKNMLDKK